jgi:cytochrome bd-type quinol oxidase subunit 1
MADRVIPAMFLLLAALQGLDLHSTITGLNQGRKETNPMILLLAKECGISASVLMFKGIAIAGVMLYYDRYRRLKNSKVVFLPMIALVVAYSAIVLNNYYQ